MTNDSTTQLVKRVPPTLVQLGTRLVPSDGRWHPPLVAQYLLEHGGRTRWVPTGEIARVFFGGNNPSNRKRVRQRLYQVFRELLNHGHLLVVEELPRGGAQACKLYDPRSEQERRYLSTRLDRMKQQRLLKTEQFQKAVSLAESLDATNPVVATTDAPE